MARSGGMSYPANVRQAAQRRGLAMITIETNGKYVADKKKRARMTLQMIAEPKLEKKVAALLLVAIKQMSVHRKEVSHGA